MAAGEAVIKVTADASGVEAGVGKARKSLATLAQTAGQSADAMTAANARAVRSIDSFVAKQQLAAATLGKSATEAKLFELAQRGASQAQLKAAESALRAVDAFNRQEAASARAQAAAARFGALVAAGAAVAATAILSIGRNSLNALDHFNDLSDATGASVENISALDRVARENGATFDTVATTLTKFNQALNASDEEGGKAAQVLKAIGLNAADLKRMDPAEALRQTAVALARFANDGDKARAVQILFGKSVQEVAPLLKDLSEQTALVGTTSTKAAQDAESFNKHLFALKANSADAARSLIADLLPALNAVAAGMKQGGLLGFLTTGGDQSADPGKALSSINDKLQTMKKLRDDLDPSKSFANSLNERVFGDVKHLDAQIAALEKQRSYLQGLQSAGVLGGLGDTGDALSRRLQPRPMSLGTIPAATGASAAAKDPLAEAKQYLESLQKQLQKTQELTVFETLLADLRRKGFAVTPELEQKLKATAQQVDVNKALAKSEDERVRAIERAGQMQQQADDAALAGVDQHIQVNQQLREEIELLGLEGQARAAVEQARLSSAIALKEEQLVMLQNAEASAAQLSALEREIVLLKERQGLIGLRASKQDGIDLSKETEKERAKFADDVRGDLSGAFQAAFASTDNPIKAFGLSLASTVQQRLAAALADTLANAALGGGSKGGGLGGLLGLFGSAFSSAGGSVNPNVSGADLALFYHGGGIAGQGRDVRRVPAGVFNGAPKYHGGGLAGDEVPAILRKGEGVFTQGQMKALGAGASPDKAPAGQPITVNQYITTTDTVSKTELDAKLRDSNRQLVAALDRQQRYGRG